MHSGYSSSTARQSSGSARHRIPGTSLLRFQQKLVTLLLLGGTATTMAADTGDALNFQSCPIVRDTETVPCWLSEYEGELYYLGIQTDISADFHPPYLGHQVIVEGVVSDAPRICGGIVLDPVVISPVAERDANCNTILPAVDDYRIDFNPRPPGPSQGRLAFQGDRPEPPPPPPPEEGQQFTLQYYHDGLVEGRNSGVLNQIVRYAGSIDADVIEVTAYSGPVLLADGRLLEEKDGLARRRAEEVRSLLIRAGLDGQHISVTWHQGESADGIEDWKQRRTDVLVRRSE